MNKARTKKTKPYRRQEPTAKPVTMSAAAVVLDARLLEDRVRDLTKPLSLRQASPARYVEREEPPIPTSAEFVLDRIQEMEQRQHWFEALLGGAGPDNDELAEIRFKRVALEQSQTELEQELKEVRRKMRFQESGLAPVHGNGQNKKQPCTHCSKLGIEKTRLEGRELALQLKEKELETKMKEVTMNERRVEEQKKQLEVSHTLLAAEKDKFLRMKSVGGEAGSTLAQREVAVMRQKHEVWITRNAQQEELRELEAARSQHQQELRDLEAARKALQQEQRSLKAAQEQENKTRTSQLQLSSHEKASLLRQKQEQEVERFRLNEERKELNSERRVLEANFRVLEAQRRELVEAQTALENRNEVAPKKSCFPFCCFEC